MNRDEVIRDIKVLALVGRLEVRDWIDLLQCHETLQPLSYLAWAACGKDPGYGPLRILEAASRSGHYATKEVGALVHEGPTPDSGQLSRRWQRTLGEAREIIVALPPEFAGQAVLSDGPELFRGTPDALREALTGRRVRFHRGAIRGALPQVRGAGTTRAPR